MSLIMFFKPVEYFLNVVFTNAESVVNLWLIAYSGEYIEQLLETVHSHLVSDQLLFVLHASRDTCIFFKFSCTFSLKDNVHAFTEGWI